MTNAREREAFNLVVERHQLGASENDIRAAFQRFLETAEVATLAEQTTEGPPRIGNPGRIDLYVHNTCIEFKTNIVRNGIPIPRNLAGNPDSPQAVVFLTSITDVMMGS